MGARLARSFARTAMRSRRDVVAFPAVVYVGGFPFSAAHRRRPYERYEFRNFQLSYAQLCLPLHPRVGGRIVYNFYLV